MRQTLDFVAAKLNGSAREASNVPNSNAQPAKSDPVGALNSFGQGWVNGWKQPFYNPSAGQERYAEYLGDMLGRGFDRGLRKTTEKVQEQALHEIFKVIPFAVKKTTALMAAYAYRFSFGSNGLTNASLARISRRIHLLCSPFTVLSAGSLDKKRRLDNISMDQNALVTESNWQMVQIELIRELEHAIMYLKKALPCYNVAFSNHADCGLRVKLARIVQGFSAQDNEQISFYTVRTICYLEKLIEQIKGFHSFDDAQQKHDQTKRWLQWTVDSFKVVGEFLSEDSSSRNRAQFPVISSSSSNQAQSNDLLNALMAGGIGG
jgi:hypothetical protein